MATKSLEVVIGADTSSLEAKMAVAKASLNEVNGSIRAMAKQAVTAGGEVRAGLTAQLTELTAKAGADRAEIAALGAEMRAIRAPAEASGIVGAFGKIHENIRLTGDSLDHLHARLNVISSAMGAFSDLMIAGLGLGAVAHTIDKVASAGEQLNQLQEEFGGTVRQLSGIAMAAQEAGQPLSEVSTSLQALTRAMQQAIATPTSKMARAFDVLGISVTNSDGTLKNAVEVYGEIAAALAKYKDGAAKTALAQDILSRRGAEAIPIMANMAGGLTAASEKAKLLGVSYNKTAATADEEFLVAMRDVDEAARGLMIDAIQPLIPALTNLARAFSTAGASGDGMKTVGQDLADALKILVEVLTAVSTGLVEVGNVAYFVGETMGDALVAVVALGEAMKGSFGTARQLITTDAHAIATQWTQMLHNIAAQERTFAAVHNALWSKPTHVAAPVVNLPNAPSIGLAQRPVYAHAPHVKHGHAIGHSGAGAEVAAARHAAQQLQQIQDASIATAQRVASIKFQTYEQELSKEVTEGKITKSQEIQDEIQAANQEYQAQKEALAKKMALYPQESAAYAKAKDAEVELEASHDRQIAALSAQLAKQQIADAKQVELAHAKTVQATIKNYQSIVQPINNAFNQTITGVLRGTETLQQGMRKAAQSIVLSFVQGAEKMAVNWAEKQLAMLISTTTTQTAITAAQTAGHAAKAAQDSASIGNDAYKAAAGAYSAVAGIPIVGPVLAPVAAAAAFAGVMAFDVISAEGGMGSVPFNDMPALLHRNEMVLPASIAQPLRFGLPAIAQMPQLMGAMSNQSSMQNHLTYAPNIDASGSGMDTSALESMLAGQQEEMMNMFGIMSNNGSTMLPGR
jgi:hypothetical protein